MRLTCFIVALFTGASASQFPEFSQQYLQRLGGSVEALGQVVADFDATAAASSLTREEALQELTGTDFLDRRQDDMRRAIRRYDVLRGDLAAMSEASAYERALNFARFTDPEVAGHTWDAFKPAVPLTTEGAVFAGGGFLAGWGGLAGLLALLGGLWRRVTRGPQPKPYVPSDGPPTDAARTLRKRRDWN